MKRRNDVCDIITFTPTMTQDLEHLYLESRRKTFTWLNKQSFSRSDFGRDTQGEEIRVAIKSQRIVGFSSLWRPETFIHHLYVSPNHLGQGIGTRLLRELQLEHTQLTLKCMVNNTAAIDFYRYHQFTIRSSHYDDEEPYHLMLWTNPLT